MDLNDPSKHPAPAMDDLNAVLTAPSRGAVAIAAGVVAATVLYCSAQAFMKSYGPAIFTSPFFVGAVVGILSRTRPVRNALIAVGIAMGLAIFTFREGVICCLFALPLVVPEAILGGVCGATIRRHVRGVRARRAVGLALFLGAIGWGAIEGALDDPARHPVHEARTVAHIAAPPARVFAALADRQIEVAADWPWFLRIGLPMPHRLRIDHGGVGAAVTATFSQGVAKGHVTEWVPGQVLAYAIDRYAITDLPFHITRLGRGPSYGLRAERVDDWLTLASTRFVLRATAAGREIDLERVVVWRRHLAPAFYFGWLQQTIMQRGQDRLLDLIRRRVLEERGRDETPPTARPAGPSEMLARR